jgi:hypothetical protein
MVDPGGGQEMYRYYMTMMKHEYTTCLVGAPISDLFLDCSSRKTQQYYPVKDFPTFAQLSRGHMQMHTRSPRLPIGDTTPCLSSQTSTLLLLNGLATLIRLT